MDENQNEELESQNPDGQPLCERVHVLGVPVDILEEADFENVFFELLGRKNEGVNIVLLSLWDLLRARRNGEYKSYVQNAALVIPISKSIAGGARFLTGKTPIRYMPFNFVVRLLTVIEQRENSLYLLGGKPVILTKTEKNIRQTFPKLRIIGRYPGNIKKQFEENLLNVIRKSAPSLLLVGLGVHGRERWLAKNNLRLNNGLRLWCSDIFEVFAERKKRPSRTSFDSGLEWIGFFFQKPVRFFRLFPFLYYNFALLFEKIKKKKH
ncbi:UDP-N-acetyl-D-mannosamine transferase [Spirochaetia bacterium]|nr:UDP-N-acetyl-D-mannosamine transferase [Spirochaetia bacterium]